MDHKYDVVDSTTGEILMEGFELDIEAAIWAVKRGYKIQRLETPDDPDFQRYFKLYQQGVFNAPPVLSIFITR